MRVDDIQPGDTVMLGKSARLVRAVRRAGDGTIRSITLAIRRCSWTRRPYTIYVRSDFGLLKTTRVPRVRLTLLSDRRLAKCIQDDEDRGLDCCDVLGWP